MLECQQFKSKKGVYISAHVQSVKQEKKFHNLGDVDFGLTRVDCKYNDSLHVRVKSVNFRCQVNLDIYLQTVEILMRRLLMSRLIRIFTVCLVNYFFPSNN